MTTVRVTGTADPAEIAAALAAVAARAVDDPPPSAYERWRAGRVAALRASRVNHGRNGNRPL
jgi:hypothetical protein